MYNNIPFTIHIKYLLLYPYITKFSPSWYMERYEEFNFIAWTVGVERNSIPTLFHKTYVTLKICNSKNLKLSIVLNSFNVSLRLIGCIKPCLLPSPCYTIKGINPSHVYVDIQLHIFCYTAIWYKTCPVSVGLGTAVIAVGQSVRIGASVLSVLGTEFSTKERLFIAMARFPKATVQVSKSSYNANEIYRCSQS